MTRAASAAACVPTCAPIEALVAVLISGTQRGFFASVVLRPLVHRAGIARGDEPERLVACRPAPPTLRRRRRRDGARRGWPARYRCRCPSRRDRSGSRSCRPALSSTRPSEAVRAGAVILGDAGNAGADQHAARLQARLLLGALPPDRMHFELVQDLRRAHRHGVGISRHGPAVLLQRVAPPELDRIERQCRCRFIDQDLERGHGLDRPVAAHRARGHAARMQAQPW